MRAYDPLSMNIAFYTCFDSVTVGEMKQLSVLFVR